MMSERDYGPLSAACVRALSDKLYEKRKAAALEIENFQLTCPYEEQKSETLMYFSFFLLIVIDTALYTDELIQPILACFSDADLRVRYYACESLYNVVKVARGSVLPHFTEIFNALSKLAADPDQNVKNGSELLDRLMKVCSFLYSSSSDCTVVSFITFLITGISWCDTVLGEFLRSIKQDPSRVDFAGMINIVILHSQSSDELLQFTALTWIKEFVQLSGRKMLPFASGILTAVLPCLAYDTDSKKSQEGKKEAITELDLPSLVDVLIKHLPHTSVQTKVAVLRWIYHLHIKVPNKMFRHVDELFPVLLRTLSDSSDEVVQQDLEVLAEIISSPAGKKLSSSNDYSLHVPVPVQQMLEAQGSSNNHTMNPYFSKFIVSLLRSFSSDRHHLLEDRGAFIIRQLCVLLNSEDIYRTLSEILLHEEDLKFASNMVETLNTILLTSSELFELRTKLKDLNSEESCMLFCCLYKSWAHNPVATVALCLLTQNYSHVCDLIRIFANLEVTVEFLTEIDKLVQLLESPIFTYLRLELTSKVNKTEENFSMQINHINFSELLKHFVSVQDRHRQHKHKSRTMALLEKGVMNLDT
ncbi:Protein VAC14 [Blattella germanica]|nr:Protein VAC14 [Blattella germanica]